MAECADARVQLLWGFVKRELCAPKILLPECVNCTNDNDAEGKHLMLLNEKEYQLSCYVDDMYKDEAVKEQGKLVLR